MRMLAEATPRVKVYSIGTHRGRPGDDRGGHRDRETLIAELDQNRAELAKLADPRTIHMDDASVAA